MSAEIVWEEGDRFGVEYDVGNFDRYKQDYLDLVASFLMRKFSDQILSIALDEVDLDVDSGSGLGRDQLLSLLKDLWGKDISEVKIWRKVLPCVDLVVENFEEHESLGEGEVKAQSLVALLEEYKQRQKEYRDRYAQLIKGRENTEEQKREEEELRHEKEKRKREREEERRREKKTLKLPESRPMGVGRRGKPVPINKRKKKR